MPKIPQVFSQSGLPDAGMSSARLSAPRGEGLGFAGLGQDMQSIALLYPSFQHAQDQRNAIAAKAADFQRSLQANQAIIQMRGAFAMESQRAMKRLDESGQYDMIDDTDESGTVTKDDPQAYIAKRFGQLFTERVKSMEKVGFDEKTMAMVGDELQKEALAAMSGFSNAVLTKRIQAGKGQLVEQLDSLKQTAGDPTDPRRDKDELLGLDLITQGERSGVLSPDEAGAKRVEFKGAVHDTRWTILAQTNPQQILAIQSDLASRSDYALPAGMDPAKFDNYVKLAHGTLTTQQSQATQQEEQLTKLNTERLDQLESDLTSKAYRGDIGQDLESQRLTLGTRYDKLRKLNMELGNARERNVTQDDVKRSGGNRFPLMVAAKGAKFTGNFDTINERVVSSQVVSGALTPQDGEAVLNAITEARAYQRTADADQNRRVGKAEQSLKGNFFVPANETKYSSQVKDLEAQALSRFYTEIERNPNQDPYVLTETIMNDYRPLVIRSKGVAIEDLTEQLRGAMKRFPRDLFVPGSFQLDDQKAFQAVLSGAISRAAVKQYQSIYETRQELSEAASSMKESQPAPKPKAGFFGKGQ